MRHLDPIRVLVIDDSAYSRQTIVRMLGRSPLVEVVDIARDGEEALRKVLDLEPDLITLDLEMPRMNGFTFLRLLMARRPTPVLVISGRAEQDDVFKALELGAVDFISKPSTRASLELEQIEEALIRKVHSIRELRIEKVSARMRSTPTRLAPEGGAPVSSPPVVVIGSSTGGPAALMQIFGAFSERLPCAFLVAQHMPAGFTEGFAARLDRASPFSVREARHGEELEVGAVRVAPGGVHLELEARGESGSLRLVRAVGQERYVPSVNRLFGSAAKIHAENVLAIVLTGMGDDGCRGAYQVKAAGGRVIAESEETAVIYGMPKQVARAGVADVILPLHAIPAAIQREIIGMRSGERMDRGCG